MFINAPFALTHSEFRLGKTDWSLICSSDSGGSVYIKLLDLLRLLSALNVSKFVLSEECILTLGGWLTSPAKVRRSPVGWRSKEDSLAVLMEIGGGARTGMKYADGVSCSGRWPGLSYEL